MDSHALPGQRRKLSEVQPEELQRIIKRGDAIGERVVWHTTAVLVGGPGGRTDPSTVNHGSAVQMLVGADRYLVTAAHVVRAFEIRSRTEPEVAFQVGNTSVQVLDRICWWDEHTDLAVILLQEEESRAIPSLIWIPDQWPPEPLDEGEYVAFAGCPKMFREDGGPGQVSLNVIGGLLRVESASDRRLTSVLEREDLVLTRGSAIPPAESELGGMSGGPVFRVRDDNVELVAVIKENSQLYDAFFFAPLSGVTLDPARRIDIREG